jgi:hypothetical protein
VPHGDNIEVEEQPDSTLAQPKICEQLRFVYRENSVDGFQFKHNSTFNEDVDTEAFTKSNSFVHDGQVDLPFEHDASQLQLPAKALLVYGLEQTRTESSVNVDRGCDDLTG